MKLELKDRVYKLTRGRAPLSCVIPSGSSKHKPLLYFDEKKEQNRGLRYAKNQKSCFEDEQDGKAIMTPIIFDDGQLVVKREDPALQHFLFYHPMNGKVFVEVDKAKEANVEVEKLEAEADALHEARNMGIPELEAMGRVLLDGDVSTMDTRTLKRDILVFARNHPETFMSAMKDPESQMKATVKRFFEEKLLNLRNKDRDVFFNVDGNKKRMVVMPFGATYVDYLSDWFKSEEGMEIFEFLNKQLED